MRRLKEPTLFVNSVDEYCGVYQYGFRLSSIVSRGLCGFDYIEVATYDDFLVRYTGQSIVIFNYIAAGRKTAPLGWLSQERIDWLRARGVIVGVIGHLRDVRYDFDFILSQNPSLACVSGTHPLPRPLPIFLGGSIEEKKSYNVVKAHHDPPIRIGSFGFASPSKGFPGIIKLVSDQFNEAEININITSASYSDKNGETRRSVVQSCLGVKRPKGVILKITEEFLDDNAVLRFLSANDLNVFNYDECDDGGVSSVIDFAVSSCQPFAVSTSKMFSHVDKSHSMVDRPLIDIIKCSKPNSYYIDLWSGDALCDAVKRAVNSELSLSETRKE